MKRGKKNSIPRITRSSPTSSPTMGRHASGSIGSPTSAPESTRSSFSPRSPRCQKKGHVRKLRGRKKLAISLSDEWNSRFLVLRMDRLEWYTFHYSFVMHAPPKHKIFLSRKCTVYSGDDHGEDTNIEEWFQFTIELPEHDDKNSRGDEGKHFVFAVSSEVERQSWITAINDAIQKSPAKPESLALEIGSPTQFAHNAHIGISEDGKGQHKLDLVLPEDWMHLMSESGLTKADLTKDPETLIKVLDFASKDMHPPPPSQQHTQQYLTDLYQSKVRNDDPREHYTGLQQVAQGGFGKVYVGQRVADGLEVAIKVIRITPKTKRRRLFNEIAIMYACTHKNIVSILDTYESESQVWVVMEFMGGGSLTDVLHSRHGLGEPEIAFVCKEVLEGLSFMHHNYRVHRDIKSDNVLLSSTIPATVKLADFGFAAQLNDVEATRTSKIGTPAWMAPEVVLKQAYDQAADVWSFGILCLEMAEVDPPLLHLPNVKCLARVVSDPAPTLRDDHWSTDFRDFVSCALVKDPQKRASADQLLFHNFLKKATTAEDFAAKLATISTLDWD